MNALVPCTACHRHVRAGEAVCPFCRASIVLDASAPPGDPAMRIGRAALFAFRAGAALALSTAGACGGGGAPPSTVTPPPSIIMQPYGAPPQPPIPEPPPSTTVEPAPSSAPPTTEAPISERTHHRHRDEGTVHALYGAPVPAYGVAPPPDGIGGIQ